MSWSVSASGKVKEVKDELHRQFAYPLAEGSAGLSDEGEKQTVRLISDVINQCLGTFGAEQTAIVSASGHMVWAPQPETGAYQEVNLSIRPGS